MNTEQLTAMGLTPAQAAEVVTLISAEYVPKAQLVQQAELLSTQNGEVEGLRAALEQLQAESAGMEDRHTQELTRLRVNAAVEKALLASHARNPDTVRPLLQQEALVLQPDGTVSGLEEQIAALAAAPNTQFLFEPPSAARQPITGFVPAQKRDGPLARAITPESLRTMSPAEIADNWAAVEELLGG